MFPQEVDLTQCKKKSIFLKIGCTGQSSFDCGELPVPPGFEKSLDDLCQGCGSAREEVCGREPGHEVLYEGHHIVILPHVLSWMLHFEFSRLIIVKDGH